MPSSVTGTTNPLDNERLVIVFVVPVNESPSGLCAALLASIRLVDVTVEHGPIERPTGKALLRSPVPTLIKIGIASPIPPIPLAILLTAVFDVTSIRRTRPLAHLGGILRGVLATLGAVLLDAFVIALLCSRDHARTPPDLILAHLVGIVLVPLATIPPVILGIFGKLVRPPLTLILSPRLV